MALRGWACSLCPSVWGFHHPFNNSARIWRSRDRVSWSVLIIKPTKCTNYSNLFFWMKLYMFRTVPLSIVRSFSLYTQQWYMSYWFADSLQTGSGQNCSSVLILLASLMTYTIAVCTVKNSLWRTGELSETCRVLFQNLNLRNQCI